MKAYDPRKPLISIHIPKCAGTSFIEVLKQWYGRRFYRHYFDERKGRMPKKINLERGLLGPRKRGVCIHGHFNGQRGFGVRDYYPEVDQFITIIRDPFELHLSNFFFMKKLGSTMYRDGKPINDATDNDYDLATYLRESARSFMLMHFPFELTMENHRELLDEHFVYVGVTDDMQASVDRLAEKLGFPTVEVPVVNVSKRKEPIPEGARERFIEANPVEWAVYQYALEHYRE